MPKLTVLHAPLSKDTTVKKSSNGLTDEQTLSATIAAARGRAGLTQEEVAQRMHTTQGNIARLETGRTTPSTRTLKKFAEAVGARLKISFEPIGTR